jgi:hypothetical protein
MKIIKTLAIYSLKMAAKPFYQGSETFAFSCDKPELRIFLVESY